MLSPNSETKVFYKKNPWHTNLARALLLTYLALVMYRFRRRRDIYKKPKRHLRFRKILPEETKELGEWKTFFVSSLRVVVNIITSIDRRMSPERFEYLLNLVAPLITKQDTSYGNWTPTKKCFLAEGSPQ